LWNAAGGLTALQARPVQTWNFTGPGMEAHKVVALCLSAVTGGIAVPWIYSWIAVSKNERAATQCAWAHLWKRIATLMFTLYGILFVIILPNLEDPQLAWGAAMKAVLPAGAMGLMIASFFPAAMSSAATYATTSSAMLVDYFCRKVIFTKWPRASFLPIARLWVVVSIVAAAATTYKLQSIDDYVKLWLSLMCFLGIPIYFGIVWRASNQAGMWLSLILGIGAFLAMYAMPTGKEHFFADDDIRTSVSIFASTALSLLGMLAGIFIGRAPDSTQLKRFYVIMNTPIGAEQRLVDAGIKLPALVDAGLVTEGEEQLRLDVLDGLYHADAQQKIFGPTSAIELRRERLGWYQSGLIKVTLACMLLIVGTWLITRILFVWR
jgi:Na+/proline symporter